MSWQSINIQHGTIAPNFLKLVDLVLTIPATTAEVERGFSHMQLMKTGKRNRLGETSMNALFRVKLLSPPIDAFDPMPALEDWNDSKNRRISKKTERASQEQQDEEDSGSESDGENIDLDELLKDIEVPDEKPGNISDGGHDGDDFEQDQGDRESGDDEYANSERGSNYEFERSGGTEDVHLLDDENTVSPTDTTTDIHKETESDSDCESMRLVISESESDSEQE